MYPPPHLSAIILLSSIAIPDRRGANLVFRPSFPLAGTALLFREIGEIAPRLRDSQKGLRKTAPDPIPGIDISYNPLLDLGSGDSRSVAPILSSYSSAAIEGSDIADLLTRQQLISHSSRALSSLSRSDTSEKSVSVALPSGNPSRATADLS